MPFTKSAVYVLVNPISVLFAVLVLLIEDAVGIDVKPDNILVNYSLNKDSGSRFSEVVLADCGDAFRVDLNADPKDMAKEDEHIIGAAIFRSPEAMLNLKWGTSTDIRSFRTTVSLLSLRPPLLDLLRRQD